MKTGYLASITSLVLSLSAGDIVSLAKTYCQYMNAAELPVPPGVR